MSTQATAVIGAVLEERHGEFRLTELELAKPGPDEVLVRVAGVGICHTDISVRAGLYPVPLPIVLGHEGAGEVIDVGAGVTAVRPGDRVILTFDSCGRCGPCHVGQPAYCHVGFELNFGGRRRDGTTTLTAGGRPIASPFFGQSSFATACVVPARALVPAPDDLPLHLSGPFGCGLLTGAGTVLNVLKPRPGDSIAIFGTGAVGLAAAMAAAALGATRVIGVDRHADRLRLGLTLGLTETVSPSDDVAAQVREISGGGVDLAVDTTASPQALRAAVDALVPGGTCAVVGGVPIGTPVELDMGSLLFGRTVRGVIEGDSVPGDTIPRLVALWRAGRFPFERLIETFPLDHINDAVRAAESGDVVKPVLVP